MIIKNGTIIDPDKNSMYKADIVVKDGIIKEINIVNDESSMKSQAYNLEKSASDKAHNETEIIDATGLYIAPGLVDTHVHFRDPGFTHKEDILTGAEAAKAGGFTQIVLMANTNPHVDNVETLKYVIDKGATTGIKIHTCANVTMDMKGLELTNMSELYSNGAVGFTDDGVPLMDEGIVKEAMINAAKLDVPISFHEENPAFIKENGINRGKASDHYGIEGSPREAEINLISRDIDILRDIVKKDATYSDSNNEKFPRIVIQHISTKEGVELVRQAKKEGLSVYSEATPHHFSLTEEAVIKYGSNAKMNPPLRTEEDRLSVIEGLKDGTIDVIATDHAPHAKDEKNKEITKAPSGIIGLETSLSLAIKNLVNTGDMTYPELIKVMSTNPCKLYNLPGGTIEIGAPADLVIFNPDENWTVNESDIKSKSTNTPFIGLELPGVIKYTICDGVVL